MKKHSIQVELPVSILREGKNFVAYTPALDISTAGKTYEEVQKRFSELVGIFFEELIAMDTLDKVLTDLGWHKVHSKWQPPVVVSMDSMAVSL